MASPFQAGVKTAVHGMVTREFPFEEKVQDKALSKVTYTLYFWNRKGMIPMDFLQP